MHPFHFTQQLYPSHNPSATYPAIFALPINFQNCASLQESPMCRTESECSNSPMIKLEGTKLEEDSADISIKCKQEENFDQNTTNFIKIHVERILWYFIESFGRDHEDFETMRQKRSQYTYTQPLLELFERLKDRYSSAGKCREEMVRLALRKALAASRNSIRKTTKVTAKLASQELCKKYFGNKKRKTDNREDEEEDLDCLLPYKKNSKYSTPNMNFIREIFASEHFHEDYSQFLLHFDDIMDFDNSKKFEKFVDFLVKCLEQNTLHKIKSYKRLPWLKSWLQTTKIVAKELLDMVPVDTQRLRGKNCINKELTKMIGKSRGKLDIPIYKGK